MSASRASEKGSASPLQRLDASLRAIQTEAPPAALAAQLAALVAKQDGVSGVRFWR